MRSATAPDSRDALFRMLPGVDELLREPALAPLVEEHPRTLLVSAARAVLGSLRSEIVDGMDSVDQLQHALAQIGSSLRAVLRQSQELSLRPVLNATGVLLHTNLGRAPLGEAALAHVCEVARGYCNLELDLETGQRGRRDRHAEPLLLRVLAQATGQDAEALQATHGVIVVNNCAAATFLALNTLAEGREVVISRGELVEIGGGFRIPDILRKSGARLCEVGTTNRTRLADYRRELRPETGLILRVHQANFRMHGFVEQPALAELIALGREHQIPVFVDQGTGLLLAPEELDLDPEASLSRCFQHQPDLICASGDKLLGGPQCGLLIGRIPLIEQLRTNPLLRAFRVDKLTYAALESTLHAYLAQRRETIPLLRMLDTAPGELRARCEHLVNALDPGAGWHAELVSAESVIGGGSAPGKAMPGFAISLLHQAYAAPQLLTLLRRGRPPVIARIAQDRLLLDLRTVPPAEDETLLHLLRHAGEDAGA